MQRGTITQLKVAVLGDGTVGKTSLLYSFSSDVFPGEYLPTYDMDHFAAIVTFNGEHYRLLLWDSPGQDELFAPVQPLLFQHVDVILLCYAIDSQASLHNAKYRWLPELKRVTPDIPFIIVGTKSDLRPVRRYSGDSNHRGPTSYATHAPIRLTPGAPDPVRQKSPKKNKGGRSGSPGEKQLAQAPSSQSQRGLAGSPGPDSPKPSRKSDSSNDNPHGYMITSSLSPRPHANGGTPDHNHSDSPIRSTLHPDLSPTHSTSPSRVDRHAITNMVEYTQGLLLAREGGASAYVECSALTKSGMDGVFQETCAAYCLKHDKLYKAPAKSTGRWRGRQAHYRTLSRRP